MDGTMTVGGTRTVYRVGDWTMALAGAPVGDAWVVAAVESGVTVWYGLSGPFSAGRWCFTDEGSGLSPLEKHPAPEWGSLDPVRLAEMVDFAREIAVQRRASLARASS